jgi:transcriptional regulator with XRE-family HTH domain
MSTTGVPEDAEIYAAIARQVRRHRMVRGLNIEQLAGITGLSVSQIRDIDSGDSRPTSAQLILIALAFRLPPEYFFENLFEDSAAVAKPDESDQELVQHLLRLTPSLHSSDLRALLHTLIDEIPGGRTALGTKKRVVKSGRRRSADQAQDDEPPP